MMRTTLDIDPKLLEEVVKATGEKTRGKAVNKVMQEYISLKKIGELRAMLGRLPLDDVGEAQRAADLRRQAYLDRLREER